MVSYFLYKRHGSSVCVNEIYFLGYVRVFQRFVVNSLDTYFRKHNTSKIRGPLEKYPTFGREKETGLLGALDT
jgi:hypothetical protein